MCVTDLCLADFCQSYAPGVDFSGLTSLQAYAMLCKSRRPHLLLAPEEDVCWFSLRLGQRLLIIA